MKKECNTCWGYGLWGMGDACQMGPMDAQDGFLTLECPECGANANSTDTPQEENTTSVVANDSPE